MGGSLIRASVAGRHTPQSVHAKSVMTPRHTIDERAQCSQAGAVIVIGAPYNACCRRDRATMRDVFNGRCPKSVGVLGL